MPPAFVFFPSFFRGRAEVDRASRRKSTLPLLCFKTEIVSLYFNSLQFIWSRQRCHFVGNPGPLIHRNLWQFTWCSFIFNSRIIITCYVNGPVLPWTRMLFVGRFANFVRSPSSPCVSNRLLRWWKRSPESANVLALDFFIILPPEGSAIIPSNDLERAWL